MSVIVTRLEEAERCLRRALQTKAPLLQEHWIGMAERCMREAEMATLEQRSVLAESPIDNSHLQ